MLAGFDSAKLYKDAAPRIISADAGYFIDDLDDLDDL